MIDEYISISAGACSKERFLNFLEDKLKMEGKCRKVGWRDRGISPIWRFDRVLF